MFWQIDFPLLLRLLDDFIKSAVIASSPLRLLEAEADEDHPGNVGDAGAYSSHKFIS